MKTTIEAVKAVLYLLRAVLVFNKLTALSFSWYSMSLPLDCSDMNDTYAVVQKRPPAPSVSSGSKSLPTTSENRSPTSSHHQYDNVRPRTMFAKPTDQLYSTVAPKPNRASNSPTFSPTTTLPVSSSYALAGAPGPPEDTANNYSQVNASSAGKEVDRGRFTVLELLPGGIRSFCCFIPGEIE